MIYQCENCDLQLKKSIDLYYFPHENSLLCENCIEECSGETFEYVKNKYYYEYCWIYSNNIIRWYNKESQLHRENDKPAVEHPDGSKHWYQNGELHRENDKPAVEYPDGRKYWYQNGKFHRENSITAIVNS